MDLPVGDLEAWVIKEERECEENFVLEMGGL